MKSQEGYAEICRDDRKNWKCQLGKVLREFLFIGGSVFRGLRVWELLELQGFWISDLRGQGGVQERVPKPDYEASDLCKSITRRIRSPLSDLNRKTYVKNSPKVIITTISPES